MQLGRGDDRDLAPLAREDRHDLAQPVRGRERQVGQADVLGIAVALGLGLLQPGEVHRRIDAEIADQPALLGLDRVDLAEHVVVADDHHDRPVGFEERLPEGVGRRRIVRRGQRPAEQERGDERGGEREADRPPLAVGRRGGRAASAVRSRPARRSAYVPAGRTSRAPSAPVACRRRRTPRAACAGDGRRPAPWRRRLRCRAGRTRCRRCRPAWPAARRAARGEIVEQLAQPPAVG